MPDRNAVKKALSLIKRRSEYEYFFSKLNSADWIDPLIEEGQFQQPPVPIKEDKGIRFPLWPETQYLVRVASQAPQAAARALSQIPLTDNLQVNIDLAEIAQQIDIEDGAKWAEQEIKWLENQEWVIHPLEEKLADLAVRLAEHGFGDTALKLTRALFTPLPDPKHAPQAEEEKQIHIPPTPVSKIDHWGYRESIVPLASSLAKYLGIPALNVFSDMLEKALRLSSTKKNSEPPTDYSFVWRDRIETDDGLNNDIRDALIDAVRDAASILSNNGNCKTVVDVLDQRRWNLFRRISLHILRVSCESDTDLIHTKLLDKKAFNDPTIHHEYTMLLQAKFGNLDISKQDIILGWIKDGKDREAMYRRYRDSTGEAPTDEQLRSWIEQWQRDRLSPIKQHLSNEWKTYFDHLVTKHGTPEFDMLLHRTQVAWRGEKSPLSRDELQLLDSKELRKFLSSWIPQDTFEGPTRAGIIQTLNGLEDDFFERESHHAEDWQNLHPAYIAALLTGFERTIKSGSNLSWASVLRLIHAIALFPQTDSDTRWARHASINLIIEGLNRDPSPIPHDLKNDIWDTIKSLLEVAKLDDLANGRISQEVDFSTAAINSLIGKGIEVAIRYAIWVKTEAIKTTTANWSLISELPEVASVLEKLAEPEQNATPDFRAIYGLQLGPLIWLDSAWVVSQINKLFPRDKNLSVYRAAVWETFLIYSPPFGQAFDILKSQYEQSVKNLKSQKNNLTEYRNNIEFHLGNHLMTYYWQGLIALGSQSRLIENFFSNASLKVRWHAIDFIGRNLKRSDEIPPEPIFYLKKLMDWRIGVLKGTKDRQLITEELEGYGWWFSSAKFEPQWALNSLLILLQLGVKPEPDHMIAEQLVMLTDTFPKDVSEVLRLMIDNTQEPWAISSWRNEAQTIIAKLSTSTEPIVLNRVNAIIQSLCARGFMEFRRFLPSDSLQSNTS